MPTTVVVTKDGKRYEGSVWYFKPADGYMTLARWGDNVKEGDPIELKIMLKDIDTATTLSGRTGVGVNIDDEDLMEKARKYMVDARKYGWDGCNTLTPVQSWECP